MNKNTWIAVGVIILIILGGWYYQTNKPVPATGEPIKIGVLAPLTGNAAELGEHVKRGLDIAAVEIGGNYELIYQDDQCDAQKGLNAGRQLVDINNVKFIIGPLCAPPFQAVSGMFNQKGVAFLHTSGVTPAFVKSSGEFGIPGLSTTIYDEDAYLANFIFSELGLKTMGIYTWNQEWAQEHHKGFVDEYVKLGGQVVFDRKFSIDDTDFRTDALVLKNSKAEGVFVVALNFQNGNIVKQFRDLGVNVPIFGQFEIEDQVFVNHAGAAAEGIRYVFPKLNTKNTETKNFISMYKNKFKTDPNYYSFIAYDAYKLYNQAIKECNDDVECVVKYILSQKEFEGVGGTISFKKDKTIEREFEIKTIKDGQFIKLAE